MSRVTFYTLDAISDAKHDLFICHLCYGYFKNNQKVIVLHDSQQAAEHLDDLLWQQPEQAFIPHNLDGEGPKYGTAVHLAWLQVDGSLPSFPHFPILINLTSQPITAFRQQELVELVPVDESSRAQAREKYKWYRQQGLKLSNAQAQLDTLD